MSAPQITDKLPNVGTTIFTKMSSLAVEHDAINLGQGFPDFAIDEALADLVSKAMKDGHNQYVHANGLPALREVLSEKIEKLYGTNINATDEITITPGGTYALYTAFTTILQPGDEVIVFEPAYDSYIPNIEINGGIVVPIALSFPEYNIPWEKVRSAITKKTKAIIINSPHNPSGALFKDDDMQQLIEITKGTSIFIISDEVYEHLVFDNKKHISVLSYPELFSRSFVSFSFGKVYNCTGWKLGYSVAPAASMAAFRKVHQYNCFTCFAPAQFALATYIPNEKYLLLADIMQVKRDYFVKQMQATAFKPISSFGSYFQLYSYAGLSAETEMQLATRLTKEVGVASIPVSAFYKNATDNSVLRFCFTKNESTLAEAAERLSKAQF